MHGSRGLMEVDSRNHLKSVTSSAGNARDVAGGNSLDGVGANLVQDTAVSACERARAREGVANAGTSEGRLASRVVRSRGIKSSSVVLDRSLDVLEDGAFDEGICIFALEGMALDVVPVVVRHVDGSTAAELGGAAASVVDVVVLESDSITRAGKVDAPVVVGVALGGPAGAAVDEVVGDSHAVVTTVAGDDMLATNKRGRNVINPDRARTVKSDSIAAPNVLGVELANSNVLDDNVGNATGKTQTLAEKHTALSGTDDGLVALDLDRV
jgi:hypothetical protein